MRTWRVCPSRSFASATGWLRTGTRVPYVLNRLGLAFLCLVIADITENLLTWAALATIHLNQPFLSAVLGVALALATRVRHETPQVLDLIENRFKISTTAGSTGRPVRAF